MSDLLSSAEYLLEHCTAPGCTNGFTAFGLPCAECHGSSRRLRHTHDMRSAVDFEPISPESLHAAQYVTAAVMVPTRTLQRLAELARVVRDPTNSAPLTELLDLVEEVTGE